jgi:Arc/MetJ-type ribon-helix-helix transcriptional regulator
LVLYTDRAQVNVRLPRELVAEVEELVRSGRFENKTEAFAEALRLLLRAHWGEALARRIDALREGTEGYPSPAEATASSHEEEDERLG